MVTFELEHKLTGKNEPEIACLQLLLKWDKEEGRGKSYNGLVLRLKEMGLKDIAEKFTTMVLKEIEDQVRHEDM